VRGQQTPDLLAELESRKALCEVKTINVSEIEAERRHSGGVRVGSDRLDPGFFTKLRADLAQAKKQMAAYDAGTKRIVYIIVNFDDVLHECADAYRLQIDQFMGSSNSPPELEVIFDIKPAFYAAMA
jgi:hypothetical protein